MKKDPVIEKLEEHDAHFENIEEKLDGQGKRLDKLTEKMIQHDVRLERVEHTVDEIKRDMATKDQVNQLITMVGQYLGDVKRLDQERVVMAGSIARIHDKDSDQDSEIIRIKTHVGMR